MRTRFLSIIMWCVMSVGCYAQSSLAPRVKIYPTIVRGVNFALARVASAVGANIEEEGVCYSATNPEPTIDDNLYTDTWSHNGTIYRMMGLEPQTIYYVRAYAKNSNGEVGYSDAVKIATLKESNATYDYDFAGNEAQNERIDKACAETIDIYHRCTNIQDYHISCHYVDGVPTADCSYGGYIRVGSNASYQATGTLLHESNHGVGVGQHWRWRNCAELREGTTRGYWLGTRANAAVRFWENSETARLNGDVTHMWPYGINGASEDEHSEIQYTANATITQALGEDGLPPTYKTGNASPSMTFADYKEGVKYYLKGECPGLGLEDGFVTEIDGTVCWRTATGPEALADDAFAWYFTFDPVAEMYYIQNVKSGRYLSIKTVGTKSYIMAFAVDTPGSEQRMHLLPSRKQYTVTSNAGTFTGQSYWIFYPEPWCYTNPPTLQAESGGGIQTTTDFEYGNSNTNQRWIIMTADEVDKLDYVARRGNAERLQEIIDGAKAMLAVSHNTTVEGIDQTLQDSIADCESFLTAPADSLYEVKQAELLEAVRAFLEGTNPESVDNPYDITFLINNPTMAKDIDGWEDAQTYKYGVCEAFTDKFTFRQKIDIRMPKGYYQLYTQGFCRPGTLEKMASNTIYSNVYGSTSSQKLMHIVDDASETPLNSSDIEVDGKYIPNTMEGAAKYFDAGKYWNVANIKLTSSHGTNMNIGVRSTQSKSEYWTVFRGFRMYYLGENEADGIEDAVIAEDEENEDVYYDLNGIKMDSAKKGINIINGKKVLIK